MHMEGLNFAIPAEFVSFSTIGLGTLFVLRALFIVLFDRIKGKQWRGPTALIPFTASVGVAFIGLVALEHIPYELLDSKILSLNLVSFVWSCFLIGSLAFVLLSVVLLRWDSGPAKTHRPNGLNHLTGGCRPRLHNVCRRGWPIRPGLTGGFRRRLKMVVRHVIWPKCHWDQACHVSISPGRPTMIPTKPSNANTSNILEPIATTLVPGPEF
jgi:hypothetical protein